MSPSRSCATLALPLFAVLVSACQPVVADAPSGEPGATARSHDAWTAVVEARIAATEYALVPEGDSLRGSNRAQGLHVTFDPSRLTVAPRRGGPEIGLSLRAWGRESSRGDVPDAAPMIGACRADGAVDVQGDCLRRVVRDHAGMTEWWENRPEGLELGFEVPHAPAGDGALVFDLAVWGATVDVRGDEATLRPAHGDGLRVRGLAAWDARGVTLPSWMEATDDGLRLLVDDAGAVGPITVDPLLTSYAWWLSDWYKDVASASGAGDVNGDGYADLIVGAPTYGLNFGYPGEAYLYLGSPSGLATVPAWTAEGDLAESEFGRVVAPAGDVNGDGYADVLVLASHWGPGPNGLGRVFLYLGSATGLGAAPVWTFDIEQADAGLEQVVAAGDVNGDGRGDVAVSQKLYDGAFLDGGRVKVFHGTATGLSATAAWTAEGAAEGEWFGQDVAAAGDVNGDGYGDLVVGGPYWSNGQNVEGKLYLYAGSPAGLGVTPMWTVESNESVGQLGAQVATVGDVNGDGYSDVLAGSPSYALNGAYRGKAWLFLGSATGPGATAAWTALGTTIAGRFGNVSGAGDVNGDGYADVAVGESHGWDTDIYEGRVHVYLGGSTGLAATASATLDLNDDYGMLGWGVSAAGDVDGDGFGDLAVQMIQGEAYYTGEVFVFRGAPSGLATSHGWTNESGQVGAAQGASVAAAGDVNGDAYGDVLVGAPLFDNGQADEGRAFLFHGSATGLRTTAAWTKEPNQGGANFGAAVASAGDVNGDGYADVAIGAPGYDGGEVDEGRVYVYLGASAGLATTAVWTRESNQAGARYGTALAAGDVDGDGFSDLVVGTPGYDGGQADEGSVDVFRGAAAGPSGTAAWSFESNQASAAFGASVASSCDVNGDGYSDLIVGASAYDNGQSDEGFAWVYLGGATGLASTPTWTDEGNQVGASFGAAVACAGDVHGDGYDDVLIGSPNHDAGQTNEGRVRLYRGQGSGVQGAASWSAESNQAQAAFGRSVASAGDVNGDGFGDVIVGAPNFDNGQTDEGRAFVYLGGSTGLGSSAAWLVEPNVAGATLGRVAVAAGDVNGDGFGDVIVGAPGYTNGQTGEGLARVYYGNGGDGRGRGLAVAPQARQPGTSTPIVAGGVSTSATRFSVTLRKMRGPWGRTKARLQVEVKPLGTPFDGTGLVSTTGWTNTTVNGVAKALTITGLSNDAGYHWRVRVRTEPAQGQLQGWGPWKYGGVSGSAVGAHVFTSP